MQRHKKIEKKDNKASTRQNLLHVERKRKFLCRSLNPNSNQSFADLMRKFVIFVALSVVLSYLTHIAALKQSCNIYVANVQ